MPGIETHKGPEASGTKALKPTGKEFHMKLNTLEPKGVPSAKGHAARFAKITTESYMGTNTTSLQEIKHL